MPPLTLRYRMTRRGSGQYLPLDEWIDPGAAALLEGRDATAR